MSDRAFLRVQLDETCSPERIASKAGDAHQGDASKLRAIQVYVADVVRGSEG